MTVLVRIDITCPQRTLVFGQKRATENRRIIKVDSGRPDDHATPLVFHPHCTAGNPVRDRVHGFCVDVAPNEAGELITAIVTFPNGETNFPG